MNIAIEDQIGQRFDFAKSPIRIVSLVPSQTELLHDLGLDNIIVGITKFCVHPIHFKATKTIIGGTKKVNFETIRALQPDLIIANKEENTLEMMEELKSFCPVWVTVIATLEDNTKMINDFGTLFNCRTRANHLNDKIAAAKKDFDQFITDKPTWKVAYFIWKNPWMVAGNGTYINEMLQINKFKNIYDNQSRYPEIELKKMRLEGDPELILLSSEPFPFKEEHAFEIGRFTHHAKTVFVDGEMFSWYGSRVIKAFSYFRKLHERIG